MSQELMMQFQPNTKINRFKSRQFILTVTQALPIKM